MRAHPPPPPPAQVLSSNPFHLKALYRRAQSWLATADWVECEQDVKAALGVEPGNADFKALAKKLRAAEAASARKEAALWAGSFKKMAKAAEKEVAPEAPAVAPAAEGGIVGEEGGSGGATTDAAAPMDVEAATAVNCSADQAGGEAAAGEDVPKP